MTKPKYPCLNCGDIKDGCRRTCETFLTFRENMRIYKDFVYSNRIGDKILNSMEQKRYYSKHNHFRKRDGKKV